MAINLSEVVNSDLGDCFTIIRTTGSFQPGAWVPNPPIEIPAFGVISIADDQALRQVPEGDRVAGSIQIICEMPIYETEAKRSSTSDQVFWRGDKYRVQSVGRWILNNFYSAILVRKTGD